MPKKPKTRKVDKNDGTKKFYEKAWFPKLFWGLLILLVSLFLLPWIPRAFGENSKFISVDSNDIVCWINYPGAVSVLEEREIELTVTNKSGNCIPQVVVSLAFQKELPIVINSPGESTVGSTVADFGCMEPKETKNTRIKFYLKRPGEITFDLRAFINNNEVFFKNIGQSKENPDYHIVFIPIIGYFKEYSLPIFSMLMLIFITFLNEALKRRYIDKK